MINITGKNMRVAVDTFKYHDIIILVAQDRCVKI